MIGAAAISDLRIPRRGGRKLFAGHLLDMRMACEKRAVPVEQAHRLAGFPADRFVEILKITGFDVAGGDAEELTVRPAEAARDRDRPRTADLAPNRRSDERHRSGMVA